MEVILGLWNEGLAGLEKNASEAETQHRAARTALAQFKKLRDSGALTDPDATRAEYEQKVREHKAASEQWQNAANVLTEAVGELDVSPRFTRQRSSTAARCPGRLMLRGRG
ncbi:hypothetical protein WKI65_38375 [Streptomyces sp. MS1.AVA.3]|uniref:hypothetical protein n=1 Tax=Streptomyces decoyicus TaxID=249567 RepID=UPI0030C15AD5